MKREEKTREKAENDPVLRPVSFPHFALGGQIWQWRQTAKQSAIAADIPTTEVDWLLQELTELDALSLRLETFQNSPKIGLKVSLAELESLWQQRIQQRSPVQYLVGSAPWRDFSLTVSPAVLIPRPETELLIDLAWAAVQQRSDQALAGGHWVDLGTGSGAIALGLARALPTAIVHAVDASEAALAIAQHNAEQFALGDRIQFHQGSWFEPLDFLRNKVNGMVSNPPYIPSDLIPTLQPEVTQHEPHLALNGGADGLDCIRHLVEVAPHYLRSGGVWLIEMMAGQADTVRKLLAQQGSYDAIQIHRDFAGIERFAMAYRR
jgi:release factor glutamine methyltransferase